MLAVKSKDLEPDDNSRACYSQGVAPKASKLSSVNRLFAIGIMVDCQENYFNVKKLLQEMGGDIWISYFQQLSFILAFFLVLLTVTSSQERLSDYD